MARTIAALVRHSEYHQLKDTPSAHQPFALTEQGRVTARNEAQAFVDLVNDSGYEVSDRIDCSNMLRAWQTAEIFSDVLARHAGTSAAIDSYDALAERGVGCMANLTIQQIEQICQQDPRCRDMPSDWKSNSHYCLPYQGAESLMQAGQRVAEHLRQQMHNLQQSVSVDTVKLFIGHGAAFRHAAHMLDVIVFEQLAKLSMFHARPVLIEYCADGNWQHIAGEWKQRDSMNGLD
jgi:2,3-bisphosphoglycerate-dependent phosphoglycerate mutase